MAPTVDDAVTVAEADDLALDLWRATVARRGRRERIRGRRVARLLSDQDGFGLILALTDEVLRVRDAPRAARLLAGLARDGSVATALGPLDRIALRAGAALGPLVPGVVVPLVRARVRSELAGVIQPANPLRLGAHVVRRRAEGIRLNVNVLGEAVVGEGDATRRLDRVLGVLAHPLVDYVSVKISSICSQIDVIAFDHEVNRIAVPLRRLYRAAAAGRRPKFVNLDMEDYRELDLTVAVFERVLDEAEFGSLAAGIVLQAYLPDSLAAIEDLCRWARARHRRTGGTIKVRVVKGANLAVERVDAEMHGWAPAPFDDKGETDAQYKRMLDVLLDPVNQGAVRVGVASHNPFETAWAVSRARAADALDRLDIEMLEGMAPASARVAASRLGGLRLYAPVVARPDIESAIAYLVRRLDENSSPENFLARQFSVTSGSPEWIDEEVRFRRAVAARHDPPPATRRTQDRQREDGRTHKGSAGFVNEPDTDWSRPVNRQWGRDALAQADGSAWPDYHPVVDGRPLAADGAPELGVDPGHPGRRPYRWFPAGADAVAAAIASAKAGRPAWAALDRSERADRLRGVADALARARQRLLAVMAADTGKTLREGDPEVSEAIDFAAYYAEHIPDAATGFRPLGTVVVASPWNFPLSIPAGGVLAALAAGNAVILKPAPESVAVAGELARVLWAGGIPGDVLHFVPCVDGDASRELIVSPDVDAVVLTGSWETARLFASWRPDLPLHAETSGKNAIVVTATADLDEAIVDLVHSAFGHAGQKCSAASLAIIEATVADDPRFLPRLADAVRSLRVGPATDPATAMGPLIRPPVGSLLDALSNLGPGEEWLVRPTRLDAEGYLWSPGVKVGVRPGSPFHLTECFGPVLGVMRAADLDEAIRWQNQPAYGLTAGLHALDPAEIDRWRDAVHAGNLYVNRGITGAVVGRQPFGGWKRSVVGPGAKAGGPQYVTSLGRWPADDGSPLDRSAYQAAARAAWEALRRPVDPTGLRAESNALRYRPLGAVVVAEGPGVAPATVERAVICGRVVGARPVVAAESDLAARLANGAIDKLRLLGAVSDETRRAAHDAGVWVDDQPVAADPSREILRWAREQAVSETRHRHGNITARRPGLVPAPVAAPALGPDRTGHRQEDA